MQRLPAFSCVLFLLLSCSKNATIPVIPDGTYTGTFQRQTAGGGTISQVTITFSGNGWTGQSQYAKYPALCNGSYKTRSGGNISFENACAWTAEFDWTLILSHDYKIAISGNHLQITRDYNGGFKDVYELTKQ